MVKREYSIVWIWLSVMHFINDFITSLIPAIILVLKYEWNLSYSSQGLLTTIPTFFMVLPQIFTGHLADRIHVSKLVFTCMFMLGFGTILMGFSYDFNQFIISACIMSLGASFTHPTIYSITSNQYTGVETRFLSFVSAAGDLSLPIVFALTGFLLKFLGWRIILLCYGFIVLILSVTLKYFTSTIVVKSLPKYDLKSISSIFKRVFYPLITLGIMVACYRIILTFTTTFLSFIGFIGEQANYVFALMLLIGAFGPILMGLLSKPGHEGRIVFLGLTLISAFSFMIVLSRSYLSAGILSLFLSMVILIILGIWPSIYSLISKSSFSGLMGLTYGFSLTFTWAFGSTWPFIAGLVSDVFGIEFAYLIISLLSIIAGLIVLKFILLDKHLQTIK
ncbi:MAG: MFS transporter [Candidatus Methanomethylicia archaeon]